MYIIVTMELIHIIGCMSYMYSQTCLKWSPVGQKSLAVIERVAALKSCLVPMEFCHLELEVSKWTGL